MDLINKRNNITTIALLTLFIIMIPLSSIFAEDKLTDTLNATLNIQAGNLEMSTFGGDISFDELVIGEKGQIDSNKRGLTVTDAKGDGRGYKISVKAEKFKGEESYETLDYGQASLTLGNITANGDLSGKAFDRNNVTINEGSQVIIDTEDLGTEAMGINEFTIDKITLNYDFVKAIKDKYSTTITYTIENGPSILPR